MTDRAPDPELTRADRVRLRELLYGFTHTQGLHADVRLGLPGHLAGAPRSAPDLAATVGADPDAFGRLLQGLAAMGVVVQMGDGRYTLTPFGKGLLPAAEGSLHGLATLASTEY